MSNEAQKITAELNPTQAAMRVAPELFKVPYEVKNAINLGKHVATHSKHGRKGGPDDDGFDDDTPGENDGHEDHDSDQELNHGTGNTTLRVILGMFGSAAGLATLSNLSPLWLKGASLLIIFQPWTFGIAVATAALLWISFRRSKHY